MFSGRVFIYGYSTESGPIRVFDKHKSEIFDLVHLSDDILASVDHDDMLLTWRATTCDVLDRIKVSKDRCHSITKVSVTEILVGTANGELLIVEHANGNNLSVEKLWICENAQTLSGTCVYNNRIVVARVHDVQVWDYSECHLLRTFQYGNICRVSVSDNLVVMGGDGKIIVHELSDGYNHLRTIDLCKLYHFDRGYTGMNKITFLNTDILMVVTAYSGIFFVSVESGQCVSHCLLENSKDVLRAAVLSDGRFCVGGDSGYCCTVKPPLEIEYIVNRYAERIYSYPLSYREGLPEANRRATEVAAAGPGLSTSEIGRTAAGNEGTAIMDSVGESVQNFSIPAAVKRERIVGVPCRIGEEKNEECDISELSKTVEILQLEMREERRKGEIQCIQANVCPSAK